MSDKEPKRKAAAKKPKPCVIDEDDVYDRDEISGDEQLTLCGCSCGDAHWVWVDRFR